MTSSASWHRPNANSPFGKSVWAGEDDEPLQHDECAPPFAVVCAHLAAVASRVDARLMTVSEGAAGCCMFRKTCLQCTDIAQRHLRKKRITNHIYTFIPSENQVCTVNCTSFRALRWRAKAFSRGCDGVLPPILAQFQGGNRHRHVTSALE